MMTSSSFSPSTRRAGNPDRPAPLPGPCSLAKGGGCPVGGGRQVGISWREIQRSLGGLATSPVSMPSSSPPSTSEASLAHELAHECQHPRALAPLTCALTGRHMHAHAHARNDLAPRRQCREGGRGKVVVGMHVLAAHIPAATYIPAAQHVPAAAVHGTLAAVLARATKSGMGARARCETQRGAPWCKGAFDALYATANAAGSIACLEATLSAIIHDAHGRMRNRPGPVRASTGGLVFRRLNGVCLGFRV